MQRRGRGLGGRAWGEGASQTAVGEQEVSEAGPPPPQGFQ